MAKTGRSGAVLGIGSVKGPKKPCGGKVNVKRPK